jgi:acetylornithine deacetylase/succinyl-diaminopimelate desuccinylase-like protein
MNTKLLELAIEIQQIPAPTFSESLRADFVKAKFIEEGLADVSQDEAGNVYARLAGHGSGLPLVAVAHLDTVFPLETDLETRRELGKVFGPGLGDNSLGVAALFGLVWMLRERKVNLGGDLWLVADVGEEGLGDLRGMRSVVERFSDKVQGYIIIEGLALGHIYHRAVGVRRYRVTARTAGGHSWSDYGQPSAVHELARLVTELAALYIPTQPRTTLNVGVIAGGTTVNTLAAEAWFELDLRSEDSDTLTILSEQAEKLITAANRSGVSVDAKVTSQRPSGEISAHHPFVQLALDCLHEQGLDGNLTTGSTDANIPLSRGIPAVVLGVTSGGGAHTKHEFIFTEPIEQGMEQLVSFVNRAWD